jgi:Fe-S cluster assembly iron-binding protein IscA
MIIFGHCTSERRETGGAFACPKCQTESTYSMRRTYNYFSLYFIPVWRLDLVAEGVECNSCRGLFPVTVLAGQAGSVSSPFAAGQDAGSAMTENLGNVVSLTDRAVAEILRRHHLGCWTTEAAVRITPDGNKGFLIGFDFALTDGRDWLGQSHQIPLLVDRRDAPQLWGKTIDYVDGRFCKAV